MFYFGGKQITCISENLTGNLFLSLTWALYALKKIPLQQKK